MLTHSKSVVSNLEFRKYNLSSLFINCNDNSLLNVGIHVIDVRCHISNEFSIDITTIIIIFKIFLQFVYIYGACTE